jgi:hypothetical protein
MCTTVEPAAAGALSGFAPDVPLEHAAARSATATAGRVNLSNLPVMTVSHAEKKEKKQGLLKKQRAVEKAENC